MNAMRRLCGRNARWYWVRATVLFSAFGVARATLAQMTVGEKMTSFGDTFSVKTEQRTYPFDAVLADSNIPANILWPGDQPTWTIQLQNRGAEAIKCSGKIDVIQYGTRGEPGEIWIPTTFKIGDVTSIPVEINLPGHGFQNVTVSPKLPETFGGYGVVADLGAAGRRFAFSCARTFKPSPKRVQFPCMSLDDTRGDSLPRLGIQAIRRIVDFADPDQPNYDKQMADLDAAMQDDLKKNITVNLMVMGSDASMPLGRARPHLDEHDVMLETKSDFVWLPAEDEKFQQWITTITSKYGWPRGPVTAMSLWDEPWEGISISGWASDMTRFHEIFKRMADGIAQSRKDAGVQVLLGGCDSTANTIDKLFAGDTDEWLPFLDVCTIHYQGMNCPSNIKKFLNRKGPNGRVKIWDTESWVANTDDRIGGVIAANKSAGYDRTMGVFWGNIWDNKDINLMADGGQTEKHFESAAWSTAASVGATVHFLGDRKFDRLLFQNGLPWVMVFDGLPNSDDATKPTDNREDGTIVVVGDLGDEFGKDSLLYRDIFGMQQVDQLKAAKQQLASLPTTAPTAQRAALVKQVTALSVIQGGTLVFDDAGGKFMLFDFYGNPVPSADHKIKLPLDSRGFFLRTDGSAGSFAALQQAVAGATINGFECLQLVPHDLLSTLETKPTMRVTCTNVLNRPITGKITATFGNLQIEAPDQLSFAANETRDVEIKIVGGDARADNTYPLTLRFDAGTDGFGEHEENMHVNVIAHRTITVDGNLDDWKGILPQTITAEGSAAPTMQEAAWFPFQKFDSTIKRGFATGYLAYDESNFYFAAKVADADPDGGTMRFEKKDDDQFYYPTKSYEMDSAATFGTKPGKLKNDLRKPFGLLKPGSTNDRSDETIESIVKGFKMKLHLPPGKTEQVAFYLLDDDDYMLGRRDIQISVVDSATGKVLDTQRVNKFNHGTYVVYRLSGDLELTFMNLSFLNASLAGMFFDEPSSSSTGAAATFVRFDEQTAGSWQGVYGKSGMMIAGMPSQYPPDVTVEFPQEIKKIEHIWPDGVRHFSYRKRPILPSGSTPNFDNIQIAFNAIPLTDDPVVVASPQGTPPMYTTYRDTDYQFALNKVADQYGGGTEIWRLDSPDHLRVNFFRAKQRRLGRVL